MSSCSARSTRRSRPMAGAAPLAVLVMLASVLLGVPGAAVADPADSGGAARAVDQTLDVLVLGDSYSAGNGATDDAGNAQTYGPDGCSRSRVNWGEKYAATLRSRGQAVRLINHACSGGVTADFSAPRAIGDPETKVMATPAGVTTTAQADAFLRASDPCNTRRFPDEEFWTYQTTTATPVLAYTCTRMLRPQADFVTSDTDLLLFTMGGNDAGFSAIVTNCFVPGVRTASGCQAKIDAARALLPQIRERLLAGLAVVRARGLRPDAKIVQLGYPNLQVDNGFTLTDPSGTYPAGAQVRALVAEGNAAIAAAVPTANVGHPGQVSFLAGVPEKFAGHEPDASTPTGNPARWILQVGDGTTTSNFYHPNRLGQTAYAELLAAQGTFGAPTGPAATPVFRPTASLRVRTVTRRSESGASVRVTVRVRLSDGATPRGRLVVRGLPGHRKLAIKRVGARKHGVVRFTLRLRDPRITKLKVVYRDGVAAPARKVHRIRRGR